MLLVCESFPVMHFEDHPIEHPHCISYINALTFLVLWPWDCPPILMANTMRWSLIPASRPLDSENHQGWRCKHNWSRSWSLVSLWLVPGIICAGFSSSQRDHICSAAKEANKRLMFISPTISISFPSAQAVSSMLEVVPELPTRIWSLLNCANQYCLLPVGPIFSYCSDHTPNIHTWLESG